MTSSTNADERGEPDLRAARHSGVRSRRAAAAAAAERSALMSGATTRSRLARATSQRTISSPPTSRMIVPWMMLETPLASSGLNEPESCAPAALQRGEQERREHDADGGVAPEQRDGDAREADVETGTSEDGDRVVHAEHLDGARRGRRTRRRSPSRRSIERLTEMPP